MLITATSKPAFLGSLFSVSGGGFEPGCGLRFESRRFTHDVAPDFVRPHLLLVKSLILPNGWYDEPVNMRVIGRQNISAPVSVLIHTNPSTGVTVLQPGPENLKPYTIAFVANPVFERHPGEYERDRLVSDVARRQEYHECVVDCFQNLFGVKVDLLRDGEIDRVFRFVSLFSGEMELNEKNRLVALYNHSLLEPKKPNVGNFLKAHGIAADVAFVITGLQGQYRAASYATVDDYGKDGTAYTYDGKQHMHHHYASYPGTSAIPTNFRRKSVTILHEFMHAASELKQNGRIRDLYDDYGEGDPFLVNKKFRSNIGDTVPEIFASFKDMDYAADPNRAAMKGYKPDWKSYHPELPDEAFPNLMDDFDRASDPHQCRLDTLTRTWLRDRLAAKINRK